MDSEDWGDEGRAAIVRAEVEYLTTGNLATLDEGQRVHLYKLLCEYYGWAWVTRPFDLISQKSDDGPIVELYPNRVAAALLARGHGYTVEDRGLSLDWDAGLVFAEARAIDTATGRFWDDTGTAPIVYERGGQYHRVSPGLLSDRVKQAKTQSRRRAILGLSGLARPDSDSEMQPRPGAEVVPLLPSEPSEPAQAQQEQQQQQRADAPDLGPVYSPPPIASPFWERQIATLDKKGLAYFIGGQQARLRGLGVAYPKAPREAHDLERLREYAASLARLGDAADSPDEADEGNHFGGDLPDQDF